MSKFLRHLLDRLSAAWATVFSREDEPAQPEVAELPEIPEEDQPEPSQVEALALPDVDDLEVPDGQLPGVPDQPPDSPQVESLENTEASSSELPGSMAPPETHPVVELPEVPDDPGDQPLTKPTAPTQTFPPPERLELEDQSEEVVSFEDESLDDTLPPHRDVPEDTQSTLELPDIPEEPKSRDVSAPVSIDRKNDAVSESGVPSVREVRHENPVKIAADLPRANLPHHRDAANRMEDAVERTSDTPAEIATPEDTAPEYFTPTDATPTTPENFALPEGFTPSRVEVELPDSFVGPSEEYKQALEERRTERMRQRSQPDGRTEEFTFEGESPTAMEMPEEEAPTEPPSPASELPPVTEDTATPSSSRPSPATAPVVPDESITPAEAAETSPPDLPPADAAEPELPPDPQTSPNSPAPSQPSRDDLIRQRSVRPDNVLPPLLPEDERDPPVPALSDRGESEQFNFAQQLGDAQQSTTHSMQMFVEQAAIDLHNDNQSLQRLVEAFLESRDTITDTNVF